MFVVVVENGVVFVFFCYVLGHGWPGFVELDVQMHAVPLLEESSDGFGGRVLARVGIFEGVVEVVPAFFVFLCAADRPQYVEGGLYALVDFFLGEVAPFLFIVTQGEQDEAAVRRRRESIRCFPLGHVGK